MVSSVYTADGFNVSGSWKVEKEIHLAAFSLGAQNLTFERGMDHLIWDFLPKPLVIEFFPGIKQCKVFFLFTTVEALLMDTLVSGKLFLRPPSQKPDYFNSHTNSVFLHSRKRPASVTDTFFASRECPPTRASTVFLISLRILWRTGRNTFKFSRLYNRIRPAKLSSHSARTNWEMIRTKYKKCVC